VAELAKLQVAAGYHHLSPYTVVHERARGVTVEEYVAQKNRGRYARGAPGRDEPRGKDKGKDKDQSKGHGKPEGHGHPHDKP